MLHCAPVLRARQRLGKYLVHKRVGEGGFAVVYRAQDTIECIPVALKVPHKHLFTEEALKSFKKEAQIVAGLDHPNILPIKNAGYIDDIFVVAYPLGQESLKDRLRRRVSIRTAINYTEQMLDAIAYAHEHRIIHCDVKPDNFILFPKDRLRLCDFGIAKVAMKTRPMKAAGTGTLGYLAPEQAFGKPTFRSDIFSLGLVLWRLFAGALPEWPYDWPPEGINRLKQNCPPEFTDFLRRAIHVDERRRFRDARQMRAVFGRLKPRMLGFVTKKRRSKKGIAKPDRTWRTVQLREFRQRFGKTLQIKGACPHCGGPVSEAMHCCPWCGDRASAYDGPSSFPKKCDRCHRGMKSDWRWCAWCYGPGVEPDKREYTDQRYSGRCTNRACERKVLMPFMKYCPWCHRKVKKAWPLEGSSDNCPRCKWGVASDFWSYCAWCARQLKRR